MKVYIKSLSQPQDVALGVTFFTQCVKDVDNVFSGGKNLSALSQLKFLNQQKLQDLIKSANHSVIVMFADQQIVAGCVVNQSSGELIFLGVLPCQAMVQFANTFIKLVVAKYSSLLAGTINIVAYEGFVPLYSRFGFSKFGTTKKINNLNFVPMVYSIDQHTSER